MTAVATIVARQLDRGDESVAVHAALTTGGTVVVIHRHRAVLMACAATVTTPQMADLIRFTSGFIQVALPEAVCDRMFLPEAVPTRRDRFHPASGQCVAVDASEGITTGISAADRSRTARALADPSSAAGDVTRPGHVVPLRVVDTVAPANLAAVCLGLSARAHPAAPGAVFADLVSADDEVMMADAGDAINQAALQGIPYMIV